MGEALNRRLKQQKPLAPEVEVALNVMVAANHLSDSVSRVCHEFNISHQQYNILRILRGVHPGGYPCGEISCRMLDRAPDITRRLDGLEKAGLVTRERHPDDRRVVITKITDAGLDLLKHIAPRLGQTHNKLKTQLSDEEMLELSRLCEKIYGDDV
jgi:DNA-binding MarR family transcriptional regulator